MLHLQRLKKGFRRKIKRMVYKKKATTQKKRKTLQCFVCLWCSFHNSLRPLRGPGSPFKSKEFLRVSLDFEVAADRQLGGLHVVHRNSSFDGSRGRVRGSSKTHVIIGYSYKLTERKTESQIVRFQFTKFVTVILKRVKMKHQSILRQNDTNH